MPTGRSSMPLQGLICSLPKCCAQLITPPVWRGVLCRQYTGRRGLLWLFMAFVDEGSLCVLRFSRLSQLFRTYVPSGASCCRNCRFKVSFSLHSGKKRGGVTLAPPGNYIC